MSISMRKRREDRKVLVETLNRAIRHRAYVFLNDLSSEEKTAADLAQREAYEALNKFDGENFEPTSHAPTAQKPI